jgi:ribosomal protein S18 acetylase RimI-like enzyme
VRDPRAATAPDPRTATFAIRLAKPEEYAAAGDLVADVYRDEGFADGAYLAVLRDAARRANEAELLVAAAPGGQIVGTITYAAGGTAFADIALPDEAEFRMLAVAAAARGQGVGERLVLACIERARRQGRRRLVMSTQRDMRTAHRLYERLGFTRAPERDWSPQPGLNLRVYALELELAASEREQTMPPANPIANLGPR